MKQTFIYIFMFLSIISQTSCEDQLNALPTQSKVEGNVIVDQASAEIALNGVYYRFASGGESQDEPAILWAIYHELTSPILTGYFTYAFGGSPLLWIVNRYVKSFAIYLLIFSILIYFCIPFAIHNISVV